MAILIRTEEILLYSVIKMLKFTVRYTKLYEYYFEVSGWMMWR